jgi:hypothetical protein
MIYPNIYYLITKSMSYNRVPRGFLVDVNLQLCNGLYYSTLEESQNLKFQAVNLSQEERASSRRWQDAPAHLVVWQVLQTQGKDPKGREGRAEGGVIGLPGLASTYHKT